MIPSVNGSSHSAPGRGAASLLERLEDRGTAEALHRLLDRADVLAFAVEAADGVFRRGDTIADSIGDSLGDLKKLARSAQPLTGLADHLPALAQAGTEVAGFAATDSFHNLMRSGLLERLGQPSTIESLNRLLDHLELLSFAATMIDGVLRRGEELMDNVQGLLAEAKKTGEGFSGEDLSTLGETAEGLLGSARQLHKTGALEELPKLAEILVSLIRSGVFDPKTVHVLAEVGSAASASYEKTKAARPEPLGPWGLLQALNDPDVQRALGFMLGMAKQYGQALRTA